MHLSAKTTLLLVVPALLTISLVAYANNSLYLAAEQDASQRGKRGANKEQSQSSRPMQTGAVQRTTVRVNRTVSVNEASWYTVAEPVRKGYRVHDLVTIIVNEVSRHSSNAKSITERESTIDISIQEWPRFTRGGIRRDGKAHGEPAFKVSGTRDFDGKGNIIRKDTLTARIQAEIIDIMPNGNLLLEATHSVTTDDETTTITLTGSCRSQDIGPGNTIMSSQLHGLNIEKKHTGMARDATKQGGIGMVLDFLNPF